MAVIIHAANKRKGYGVWSGTNGIDRDLEQDTITCAHCNKVIFIEVGKAPPGGGCRKCGGMICDACVDLGVCKPIEQQLLELERSITKKLLRDANLREAGII